MNWKKVSKGHRYIGRTSYRTFLAGRAFFQARHKIKSNAKVVLWIPCISPFWYLRSDNLLKDSTTALALANQGISFQIVTGLNIGNIKNSLIFVSVSPKLNIFNFENYTSTLQFMIKELESQGNTVSPSFYESCFWENKAFMHNEFNRCQVNTPKTEIINDILNFSPATNWSYPFLIKEIHSAGSLGLHKIASNKELQKLKDQIAKKKQLSPILVQELIEMRRDLRVILVGEKIVLHYWRINLGKEWKPTSTSKGSEVDFITFPEKWRQWIIDTFKRLDLNTGAFDITWPQDNLNNEPLILEVSPSYQPNPSHHDLNLTEAYGDWKRKFGIGNRSYDFRFFKITEKIQTELVKNLLNKLNIKTDS